VIVSHRENIRRLLQRKENPLAGSTGKKTR
jgi:glycerol-3-phosphate acyltransferase PlsY